MFESITGIGQLHPSIYASLFGLSFMVLISTGQNSLKKSLIVPVILTGALFFSPILFLVVAGVGGVAYMFIKEIGEDNKKRWEGTASFTHWFFNVDDNRFSGFRLTSKGGASSEHISQNDVSEEMYNAAQKAVSIDPHNWCDASIIVMTEVVEERGKPVIYDHIVTRKQLEDRYDGPGYWDKPEDYKGLPAPEGLLAVFMSDFNGPKLKRVRRN
jgi:hypothetical protein